MGFFKKLFGSQRPAPEPAPKITQPIAPANPGADMIRIFDQLGREGFVPRETWRTVSLPGAIKRAWNDADELYTIVLSALNDGFRADVLAAAERVYKIDPNRARAACMWGVVLMEEKRLNEAEKVFGDFLQRAGPDGHILANLAKVQFRRNQLTQSEETLWRALTVDPNQENAAGWYHAIHKERGGEAGRLRALERMAALPNSWLAPIWLGQAALTRGDLREAIAHYQRSLSHSPTPATDYLLESISGELGKTGHLREIITLVEPHFDPQTHGIRVANNIIKAHVDLKQLDEATAIVEKLYSRNRHDWKQTLSYWDTEISKSRLDRQYFDQSGIETGIALIVGPVWLAPTSSALELFGVKPPDELRIAFTGCSATLADAGTEIKQQLADAPGRLSRALPLFLAEQIYFRTRAAVSTMILLLAQPKPGFVLAGTVTPDDQLIRQGAGATPRCDFIVNTHLVTTTSPWTVQLRGLRVSDSAVLFTNEFPIDVMKIGEDAPAISEALVDALVAKTGIRVDAPPPQYVLPAPARLGDYMLRLEQLLAVRVASMSDHRFLYNEREIIDGMIALAASCTKNLVVRLILARTIVRMNDRRPEIIAEFAERLTYLKKQHPLDPPEQAIVEKELVGG